MAKTPKSPKEEVQDTVDDAVIVEETMAEADTPAKDAPEEQVEASDDGAEDVAEAEDVTLAEPAEDASEDEPVEEDTPEEGGADDASQEDTPEEAEAPADPMPPVLDPAPRRGGFAPMVLGGVIAAALGFAAAQYPDDWPFGGGQAVPDPLTDMVAAQAQRLDALEQSLNAQGASLSTMATQVALDELSAQVATDLHDIQTALVDLETRLSAVEKLPTGDGAEAAKAAAEAYERELAELRAMFEGELAKVSAVQEDAEALSANAATRAALANIMAALDSGAPFTEAAAELSGVTGEALPDPLPAMADKGVPTLAGLQADFPEAARDALAIAIRTAVEDGSMSRTQAFLRTQLGVRSLEPKEGDDPDAILSRAEEALRHGQITVALDELSALPEAAQPALATWIATAKARVAALEAGQTLATQLNK